MKKIIYFSYPTESGGVIFQNGYLDKSLKRNENLYYITKIVESYNMPEIGRSALFLQGSRIERDLNFQISKSKPDFYDKAIDLINKINNGDIDV